jgi:hypothetical protein
MNNMEFSHNEEFYTATLVLLILAMKHRESAVRACSIPVLDWDVSGEREVARLEALIKTAGDFALYGGPDRNTFAPKYHFDPDLIVANKDMLMLIEVKKSKTIKANRLPEYLTFVGDACHPQSIRWLLLVVPRDWWTDARRESWRQLREQAGKGIMMGWITLEDVVRIMQEKVPHEPALRKYRPDA